MKSLLGFLGLAGFYSRFVKGYAQVAGPLNTLLRKDGFGWNDAAEEAFRCLKKMLTKAPLLRLPDFSIPFTVKTDASGTAMGVVLQQEGCPIAFFNRAFPPTIAQASTYMIAKCVSSSSPLRNGGTTYSVINSRF